MVSMITWLGPGAVMGGLGAAILFGAGAAGADTTADAGMGERAAQVSSATDKPARSTARSGATGIAAARSAAVNKEPRALASPALPAAAVRTAAAPTASPAASSVPVVPSNVPIDPAQYAGTYYEQGSVKQLFNIGLVNTKAVYTLKPNGTLGVQNSGNYFFKRGLKSSITGSAVPVNSINTALNVGFGGTPSANPPGNYLIVDRAPDYSWVIVSDPSGRSGFILTRSQTIDPQTYQQLVAKARALGVQGRITPTLQIP